MDPHPDIAEDEGDGDEQESQCWVTSGGFDPGLIKLAVAGLNSDSSSPRTKRRELAYVTKNKRFSPCKQDVLPGYKGG